MPSTFTSLHYHIVFSTKNRAPMITKEERDRLHAYIGGVTKGIGGVPCAVGGVEDHVHLLIGLKPSTSVSDFVRDLKKRSTAWAKEHVNPDFAWQEGYAAFTIGIRGLDNVRGYISTQEEHHKSVSFLDELRAFLDEAGIPYEEQFLV